LTGLEIAAETAERWPGLQVHIVSSSPPGAWLSDKARRYLTATLDTLGIERVAGRVEQITPGHVELDDGRAMNFDVCYWAGGFQPSPLVSESGLTVDGQGRAVVDSTLQSVSHQDVYVVGDAAGGTGGCGA